MTPFRSLFEAVVFWGVLGFSVASAVRWIARHHRPRGKRRRDLMPLIFVVLAADIAIGYARVGPLPHWLFYPGEALFVLGAAFTAWSYSHLGRYLTPYAEVLPEHQVIEDGPYGYIRHPGYLGAIVALTGLGLALQSWVALLASLLIGGSLLGQRIHVEEELMSSELGDRFIEYKTRTKRFVPFVW
jgi:protein-S-isoprenylcysteine O-methyltransferase Ste14